jgi:hypothetical protein
VHFESSAASALVDPGSVNDLLHGHIIMRTPASIGSWPMLWSGICHREAIGVRPVFRHGAYREHRDTFNSVEPSGFAIK